MRALSGGDQRASTTAPISAAEVAADQRERLLRATGELVAKRGYNKVTVELIIKRAQLGGKTFYKHFPNKEAAFLALFDEVVEEARERVEADLAARPDAPWPEQVAIALQGLFDVILVDPLIAKAVLVETPTVGAAAVERYESALQALAPLFALGRQYNPQARDLPARTEETIAGGVLWGAYQRLIVGEGDRIAALLPEAVVFVLRPYLGAAEASKWAEWSREK